MLFNTWIIIGIIFFIAVICILFGVVIWMLFFRKVTVLTFDSKGNPYQVIKGTKKGKSIWFKKINWVAKEGSYWRFGKNKIYLAQRIDEDSMTAYVLDNQELKADESWLEALNNSYRDSALKFKFGFEKYKELITLLVTSCFICIMVLGAVKYTTDLTPVEVDAIKTVSQALEQSAKYNAEGAKANKAIVDALEIKPKVKEPPK